MRNWPNSCKFVKWGRLELTACERPVWACRVLEVVPVQQTSTTIIGENTVALAA